MAYVKRNHTKQFIRRILFGSDHQAVAWFELLLVTLVALTIWRYQHSLPVSTPRDYFYWPMLGPVLIALRYGFGRGMMCFALLIIGMQTLEGLWQQNTTISLSVSVGTAVVTMLIGEFRDHWHELNQRYELDHRYMDQKLRSFTQSYQLLKISHDQLEQRAAGKLISLRTAIQLLQQAAAEQTDNRLNKFADQCLHIFADVVGMYQAGIYAVKDDVISPEPLAVIGENHSLEADNLMVKDLLESRAVLSPADLLELEEDQLRYQLAIPLMDVTGKLQAVVLAEKVKFVSLTQGNIALLALLSGYMANFMSQTILTPMLAPNQRSLFLKYIEQQAQYKKRYGADSALVIFFDNSPEQSINVNQITDYRRDADVYWSCQHDDGRDALCVLLPMSTTFEAGQFIDRVRSILSAKDPQLIEHLDVTGPLIVFDQYEQVTAHLEQLGNTDESLADTTDDLV